MSSLAEVEQYCGVVNIPWYGNRIRITQQQFEEWQQTSVLDALKGIRPGRSFCNRFDIVDMLLYYNTLEGNRLTEYIQGAYVTK